MSADSSYLWVLNPDAERELAASRSYAVRAAFIQRIAERRALFEGLVQGEATVYSHELEKASAPTQALFWCPTSRVRDAARASGLMVGRHPTMEVLRAVHDKRFLTTALSDACLPGRCNVNSEKEWRHLRASMRGPLRLKRPYGYAGKGQRIWPESGGEDHTWLADSLRKGGFIAEPHIQGSAEFSLHGFVDGRGVLIGAPCRLETDAASAPISITRAPMPDQAAHDELRLIAERVAERLLQANYFGPWGLDALIVDGSPRLIDLNPRFTLGWSIGMGEQRAEAIVRALSPEPPPGDAVP